jgi:GT2 family glycosyltransferase
LRDLRVKSTPGPKIGHYETETSYFPAQKSYFWLNAGASAPKIIYSDEDKIDAGGVFVEPHFKPDYNYTLLLAYNYICHFVAIEIGLLREVGELSSLHIGAQDYDLILRCCERIKPRQIRHIPMILYHWRSHEGSTAMDLGAKSYALDAGLRAVAGHMGRTGQDASVTVSGAVALKVTRAIPTPEPTVSIVIPTRDNARILSVCVSGLLTQTRYKNIEIIVVDNGSKESDTFELFAELRKSPQVRVVPLDIPFNYSAICNFGARQASADFLLMLNNDIEILEEDWLREMVSQALAPQVGAVGAKLFYPDGRVQHGGVILGIGGVAGHAHKLSAEHDHGYMNRLNVAHEVSACTAACLLIHRKVFEAVGGFDDVNLPVAFNDVDLCLRILEAGYRVVFNPHARLRHYESLSRGTEEAPAKVVRSRREVAFMMQRWGALLRNDPFYSPNLTLEHEDFSIDLNRGVSHVAGRLS